MEEKVPRDLEGLRDQKVIKLTNVNVAKIFLVTQSVASIFSYDVSRCFFLKFTGDVGGAGPQGPAGPQGTVGPEGPGRSGVSYNRWGRTNCSGDATTVYTGKEREKGMHSKFK